ncbi:unnamed protein product [Gordionus sp. m RMFG-2023]
MYGNALIKNRDVVGYGNNGEPVYFDIPITPCPAIRFKENTPEVLKLREKEMKDWKNLSIEEKKELYRNSFRQTYSEMNAYIPYWKNYSATTIFILTISIWMFIYTSRYVFDNVPSTYTREYQEGMLKQIIESGQHPITGPSSRWDFENRKWKN